MKKTELITHCNELVAHSKKMVESIDWQDRQAYINWLSQALGYVEHSTRFLHLVAGQMPLEKPELFKRFSKHVAEELGHERLLINDLKAMGAVRQPPDAITTELVNYQKEQIKGENPLYHFGYIIFLENLAIAAGPYLHKTATSAHGAKTGSFLKVHAYEDIEHVKDAYKALDSLNESEFEGVFYNMKKTAELYNQLLKNCSRPAQKNVA